VSQNFRLAAPMKALVAGWFSFEGMGATAGDLLARDVVCEWLERASFPYDLALAKPFSGGVDWQAADAASYSLIVFVCGPFGNGWPVTEFLSRFAGRKVLGVNLSMLQTLETWNPFDLLLERDSSRGSRPDLAFLSQRPLVPVVGLVLSHPQAEYRERGLHSIANEAIRRLAASRHISAVCIDTRLDVNSTGLRTPSEVESLMARMDVVLTTRLHGLVLALKRGVPVVAIDPIAGGAKLRCQASIIGWPFVYTAGEVDDAELAKAFDYCLTAEARVQAQEASSRARSGLVDVCTRFLAALAPLGNGR
jgi:hypothetical protein